MMNAVLVATSPKLSRGDQAALVRNVVDEAMRSGHLVQDFFAAGLVIARVGSFEVSQVLVDAINSDPDMIALPHQGDPPSNYGYVIRVSKIEEVHGNKTRIFFHNEDDCQFVRGVMSSADNGGPDNLYVWTSSTADRPGFLSVSGGSIPRIVVDVGAMALVIDKLLWEQLKYPSKDHQHQFMQV